MLRQLKTINGIQRKREKHRLEGVIEISVKPGAEETGMLNKCLVWDSEDESNEGPTLSEIRRWSSTTWKIIFGVNIYEMNNRRFLFEFPNRFMADQIVQHQWYWQKNKLNLKWWSSTEGCTSISRSPKETWIRDVGIPLQLWSHKVI